MEVQEFEIALTDLETRVDRLRALYENWFRGYEKMEPAVARKDAERRVYALRKELPRNTALRFRYHQLYQRFTTLANYWQRTARQIEEGTYRLQLQRIKRRRTDEELGRTRPPLERGSDSEAPPARSFELSLDETLDVKQLLDDLDMDEVANAIDAPGPFGLDPFASARPAARASTPSLSGSPPSPPRAPQNMPPVTITGSTSSRPGSGAPTGSFALPPPAVRVAPPAPLPSIPTGPLSRKPAPPPVPPASLPRPSLAGSVAPRPPPPPVVPAARASAPQPEPALAEQRLRRLYDEYSAARRKNNEGEVRYETLVSSIERMIPELRKKHQGKQIDFEIVLKDGRVGLKPKPL